MSLENMKFIVKEVGVDSTITYWKENPIANTLDKTCAAVFTWNKLTITDKIALEDSKGRLRIIPVGGLNAAH